MSGGRRRRHCPPALTPEQVRSAARQLQAGRLIKQLVADLGVERSTLYRALSGKGSYAGILPAPITGRCGSRPLLTPEKVAQSSALSSTGTKVAHIATALNCSVRTAQNALSRRGAYARTSS